MHPGGHAQQDSRYDHQPNHEEPQSGKDRHRSLPSSSISRPDPLLRNVVSTPTNYTYGWCLGRCRRQAGWLLPNLPSGCRPALQYRTTIGQAMPWYRHWIIGTWMHICGSPLTLSGTGLKCVGRGVPHGAFSGQSWTYLVSTYTDIVLYCYRVRRHRHRVCHPGPQSFGMAIREFRTLRSISQAELAGRSGIYRSHLSSLERGSTTRAMRDLIAAYRALDLEIAVPEAICRPRYLPGSCQAG